MLVAPRMLSALVEEKGLKSWLTGPDGLLSITSVEEEPELAAAVELDELEELHAPSASAPTAHSVAAIVVFFLMIAPRIRPARRRRGMDYRLRRCSRRGAASRPPHGPRPPICPEAAARSRSAWRGGIGGGTGSPRAVWSGSGPT